LCGMCIYAKFNAEERAIYTLGRDIGPFFEEIEWEKEHDRNSEYLTVVNSELLGKVGFYSSYRPKDHSLNISKNNDTAAKKVLDSVESDEIYYPCF
jgi:hypothetical protein